MFCEKRVLLWRKKIKFNVNILCSIYEDAISTRNSLAFDYFSCKKAGILIFEKDVVASCCCLVASVISACRNRFSLRHIFKDTRESPTFKFYSMSVQALDKKNKTHDRSSGLCGKYKSIDYHGFPFVKRLLTGCFLRYTDVAVMANQQWSIHRGRRASNSGGL